MELERLTKEGKQLTGIPRWKGHMEVKQTILDPNRLNLNTPATKCPAQVAPQKPVGIIPGRRETLVKRNVIDSQPKGAENGTSGIGIQRYTDSDERRAKECQRHAEQKMLADIQAAKAAENERMADLEARRREAEERRLAEEATRAEEKRKAGMRASLLAEEKRLRKERTMLRDAEARAARITRDIQEAEKRARQLEERQAQAEAARVEEERRQSEIEAVRITEEQRLAEERRLAEEAARLAEELAEIEAAEERRRAEERRLSEEDRVQKEMIAEERRLAEIEAQRRDEKRRAEKKKARREEKRLAEIEARRLEEKRIMEAEEARMAEERRQAELGAVAEGVRIDTEGREEEARRQAVEERRIEMEEARLKEMEAQRGAAAAELELERKKREERILEVMAAEPTHPLEGLSLKVLGEKNEVGSQPAALALASDTSLGEFFDAQAELVDSEESKTTPTSTVGQASTGDEFFPADSYVDIPKSDDLSVYEEDEADSTSDSKKRKKPSCIIM